MQPSRCFESRRLRRRVDDSQMIFYVGRDQQLYRLFWQRDIWTAGDVFSFWQAAGIALPPPRTGSFSRSGTPLASNTLEAGRSTFLFYLDANNHVQGLPFPIPQDTTVPPGSSMAQALDPDLTVRTGAPVAMAGSPLAGYAWQTQSSQHAIYVGDDGAVWELYWSSPQTDPVRGGALWQSNNLSARTGLLGTQAPRPGAALAGCTFENQGSEHVFYIAQDDTIRELYSSTASGAAITSPRRPARCRPPREARWSATRASTKHTARDLHRQRRRDPRICTGRTAGFRTTA